MGAGLLSSSPKPCPLLLSVPGTFYPILTLASCRTQSQNNYILFPFLDIYSMPQYLASTEGSKGRLPA
jgi:hypothetical protein